MKEFKQFHQTIGLTMVLISRLRNLFFLLLLLSCVPAFLTGCALKDKEAEMRAMEMEKQIAELQEANSQLTSAIKEEKSITAKLQMALIEKQSKISSLKSNQANREQEVAQKTLRIPVPSTRAEAVTYLAEMRTEIDTVRESKQEGNQQIFQQADTLLDQSKNELAKNNYDTACLLASQAMELIHNLRINTALQADPKGGMYTEFIKPLQLEVVRRSNIRTKAGKEGRLADTLEAGTPVTAHGYKGNWIKVKIDNGHEGWIYFTLLNVPQTSF